MGGGRNEIALAVIGTALLMTSSSSSMVEAAQQGSVQSSSNQTPRRAAFVRTPITNHQRAQYLRRAQQQSTEQKRLQLERNAKQKLAATEKVERMQAEAKGKLGLSASSKKKKELLAEKDDEEEMVPLKKAAAKKEETDGMTTTKTTTSSSSSSHVKVHSHAAPKASELEEADEFESFNPLDLFAALEGTKKTPFEKQTTASGEVVENAVLNKKDKLSSVFATMLGSMMEVSRGVDESTGTTVSSNNSCVKATRNVAVSCFKEYSAINEDVKAGKLSADESTEKMELLRETCADKSRVINTQCVKPIAEMCSSQVQEIKKECAKGIVGSEELTLNKALDSASAAAQQCAAQASSLLKSCMKQSKTLSPDLKELAMIDSKAEERAKEIKKEKEIQDKVNESMKDLSFSSSSSTLAQKEEDVVTMLQPGEQVEVVAASKPVIVARHHSSSLAKMKLPVVTEDVEEVERAATTVSTTTPTATVQTLSVPQPVLTTAAADATATTTTTTIEEQPEEEEEEEKEQQQQPEETEEEQAVDEEADSGCAGALSKVTADCQLSYKQINDKVKSGEVEEAAGKEQIAVAARQCVAKTMLATSNCVDKVQRRRLMSLAK
jgi:hypothetical protein